VFKKLQKETTGRRKSVELEKMPKPVGPKQTRLYLGVTTVRMTTQITDKQDGDEVDQRLPFMMACEANELSEIKKFIEGKKLSSSLIYTEDDQKGETPLMKMARHGLKDEIRDVIAYCTSSKLEDAAKFYINMQDKAGKSAIFHAAECHHDELVDLFLKRGADPLAQSGTKMTILHHAVQSAKDEKHVKVVETILQHERVAPVKKQLLHTAEKDGRTPILIASFKAIDAITNLLLKEGADPTVTDANGLDAVALATRAGRKKSKELLEEFIKAKEGAKA